jgi:hypothetical protein
MNANSFNRAKTPRSEVLSAYPRTALRGHVPRRYVRAFGDVCRLIGRQQGLSVGCATQPGLGVLVWLPPEFGGQSGGFLLTGLSRQSG